MISAALPLRRRPSRLALFGIGLILASALSCGREITAPGGAAAGAVQLRPVFAGLRLAGQHAPVSVSGLVDFVRVRIVLLRANGDTAVNRVVEFPADSQSLSLTIPVVLSNSAPAEGETLAAALRFVNAAGDTVFSGGPIAVQARPLGATPAEPPAIPVTYTGPGATAASLTLSADTVSGRRGETKTLTATVRDASGAVLSNVPIAFSSLDTAMATVGLTNGTVSFNGIRGQTRVVAQTLTGQADTALVLVFPIPTAIAFAPEAIGQQTRQRDPFPTPAAVKVTAADGLPVTGTIIDFTVTRGKGTVSQAKDTTDANGIASVTWTAGDSVGTGELSARVSGGTLTATLTGVQLNAGPTSLRFVAQPTNVVAQDTMPALSVVVLDAIADTVRAFTGPVRVRLAGGRAGALLTGTTAVNAVAGVARFTDLAVDRDGTGYTLIATLDSSLAVPSLSSTTFNVTPRPIGSIALLSGGGQSATFGTAFATPVIFQVRGLQGEAIRDAIVNFAATGGGSLSQVQDTSDALGQVSVLWTAGTTAGDVTLTATALGTSISGSAVNRQGSAAPAALEFMSQPVGIVAGDTLPPIRVRVLNGLGQPITDYVGSAIMGLNGGTAGAVLMNNGSGVPFTAGVAEFRGLSVDRAGTGYRLKAQVTSTAVVALSDSAFTVAPAPPTTVQVLSGGFQSAVAGATLADSVVVRVVNRFGEGVASQVVTFAVTGGGSVSATSAVTDASGRAAVRWTTGLTGDQQLVATVGTLTATVVAYIPQGFVPVSGAGQRVFHGEAAPAPIVFRVVQANGSAVRGIPVTFSATEGGGTVAPVNVVSDSLGEVRTQWTAGSAYSGDVAIKAEIPGMPSAFSIAVVTQGTRNVTALRFRSQPTAIVAGDTLPTIAIAALNGLGDTATTYTGSVRLGLTGGPTDARLLGTTTVNAVAGIARFPALTVDRAATAYRLLATLPADTTVAGPLSDPFAVSAAPAATLALVSGGGQTVPQGLTLPDSIVVLVKDRFGIGVQGATVTFAIRQGGGTVAPTSRTTDLLGRAATAWTTGLEGVQRLAVVVPGIDTLFVSATALASNGAPVLFASVTDLQAPVGRTTPVRLFLSNPAPTPIPVTLTMGSGIARWTTASATIPVGGTTLDLGVIGDSIGASWAIASSPVGRDSIALVVDSATMRFVSAYVPVYVTDTVRTRIILDRPAPAGGLTLTVVSRDSLRVKVAAGDGRGYLEEPASGGCMFCEAVTDERPSILGPVGGTATIAIPAGEMIGHLVLLPVDSTLWVANAEVVVKGAGLRDERLEVYAVPARLDQLGTGPANSVIGVGQYSAGFIDFEGTDLILRRDLPVRIRPLAAADSALVTVLDTLVLVPRGVRTATVPRMVEGKAAGIARLLVTAEGFAPDTVALRVDPAVLFSPYASTGPTTLAVDEGFVERIALGAESPTEGKSWGTLRREPTRLSIAVANPTVLAAPTSVEVLGTTDLAEVPLRGKTSGTTTVTFSAPGYASFSWSYQVVGGSYGTSGATSVGVSLIDDVSIYRAGGGLTTAIDWTVTASDTGIVRVLSPTIRMPAGNSGGVATVRIEGRRLGATTLIFAGDGQTIVHPITTTADVLDFWDPSLAGIVEADSIEREILVFTGSMRPFAAPVEGRLRSSDPTKIVVTDSILRFRPDSVSAVARIRVIGTTTPSTPVALTLTAPGFESSTAAVAPAPAKLHLLPVDSYGIAAPPSGVIQVGRGLAIPVYVQRWTPTTVALPLTFTRTGTAATSVAGAGIGIAAGEESQLIRLRGGAVLGLDTVVVSAPGLRSDTLVVEVVPLEVVVTTGYQVAVEQRADVGAWTSARSAEAYSIPQRVGDSTQVRLVSLDTGIVKVEQDTLLFVPQADGAVRLGRLRGIAPGIARLRALRPGTTDTLAAIEVMVERPRLLRPFSEGELALGMRQRTDAGELFVERSHLSGKGLWVRLTSSAPRVATVPDSVLIPPDSSAVHFIVTAGDSVGGATITASADRHSPLTFPVTVTRARLLALTASIAGAIDEVSAGVETPVGVFALTPASGGTFGPTLRATGEDPAIIDYYLGGTLRPTTVPIPVRLRVADATRATVLRDTATIPVGEAIAKLPGLAGAGVGSTTLTIEDRRGDAFQSLLATASTLKVTPAVLAFRAVDGIVQVPFLGTVPAALYVESRSTANRVVATMKALPTGTVNGIALTADSLLLRPRSLSDTAWTEESGFPCYDFYFGCFPKAAVALRGLALGTYRVVAEAPGHRPDTITVEVTGAQLVGPSLPGSLAVGDSVRVDLTFASSTGSPMALGSTPVQLTIATGTGLQATAPTPLVSVVTGGYHSCGLTATGSATCWGYNLYGQALGNGTSSINVESPTAAAPGFTFAQLAAGFASTCGRTSSGAVWCWGDGSLGNLGNGALTNTLVPVQVTTDSVFTSLVAGYNHYCGLTASGVALCWGRNSDGQLGRGTAFNPGSPLPEPVAGTLRFTTLFSSYEHTCGIATDGKRYCWGDNAGGKLGDGTDADRLVPTAVVGGDAFVEFAIGLNHTCARTATGAASCWGNPWKGALGNGVTSGFYYAPQPVAGSLAFTSIASGADHVCGTVAGGVAYCWGKNDLGQGGIGSTLTAVTTPTAVSGGLPFVSIDPGTDHTCGRLTNGTTRCWGYNQYGQVGTGTLGATQVTPLAVGTGGATTAILVPANATGATFWLKGISAGPATVTVSTPNFTSFTAALTVR